MAPSGYVQVDPPKQRKGILRPGVAHLRLPLVERHSRAYNGSEESLLSLASSHWTISAAPKSSASMYSQSSYATPPPVFLENKVDRRRFGITKTPAQEGPWSRPIRVESPPKSTFVLNLNSTTHSANPFIDKNTEHSDLEDLPGQLEIGVVDDHEAKKEKLVSGVAADSKEVSTERKKLRSSIKVLGKMLSRFSIHQPPSSSGHVHTPHEEPPVKPPQILIALPSPDLKMASTPKDIVVKDDLRSFVLEKNAEIPRNRSSMSSASTWKPRRPPSPLPKSMRKHRNRRSDGSALANLIIAPPPPPLPVRPRIQSTVLLEPPKDPFLSFSTPLNSAADIVPTSPCWEDIQTRLKARAMKSSTYAVYNGGMISPTSS